MINVKLASTVLAAVSIGGLVVAPTFALAADPDHDHGRGKNKGSDRGRKEGWDRGKGNPHRSGGWQNNRWEDQRRRDDERRREEQRRRDEERRRNDAWRREQDRNRFNNNNNWNRNDSWQREYDHRQDTKNEWRNIALLSGGVAVLGLLKKDNTLTFAGTAGALYSLYRYEQDRKSQNSLNRARASYFSHPYFYRDGNRYDRFEVNRNGQRYYQFRRH